MTGSTFPFWKLAFWAISRAKKYFSFFLSLSLPREPLNPKQVTFLTKSCITSSTVHMRNTEWIYPLSYWTTSSFFFLHPLDPQLFIKKSQYIIHNFVHTPLHNPKPFPNILKCWNTSYSQLVWLQYARSSPRTNHITLFRSPSRPIPHFSPSHLPPNSLFIMIPWSRHAPLWICCSAWSITP